MTRDHPLSDPFSSLGWSPPFHTSWQSFCHHRPESNWAVLEITGKALFSAFLLLSAVLFIFQPILFTSGPIAMGIGPAETASSSTTTIPFTSIDTTTVTPSTTTITTTITTTTTTTPASTIGIQTICSCTPCTFTSCLPTTTTTTQTTTVTTRTTQTTTVCSSISYPWAITVATDRTIYTTGDLVLITAHVTGGPVFSCPPGWTCTFTHPPILASIHIYDQGRNEVYADSHSFAITYQPPFYSFQSMYHAGAPGTFSVVAEASTADYPNIQASTGFAVATPTSVAITTTTVPSMHAKMSLSTTDASGNQTSTFTRGQNAYVKVVVTNDGATSLNNVYVLLTIYDSNNAPVFFGTSIISLPSGQQSQTLFGWNLPANILTGTYQAQVVVLTNSLAAGGHFIPDGAGTLTFSVI